MRILSENSFLTGRPVVIAIGTFDGMHKGHVYLVRKLIEISRSKGYSSMVYTFKKHPLMSLDLSNAPSRLISLEEKVLKLKRLGLDNILIKEFNTEFAKTLPHDFITQLLTNFNMGCLVIGNDFNFGYNKSGDSQLLHKYSNTYGFKVYNIPPYRLNGHIVSSSLIRNEIMQGRVEEANDYLGYQYFLTGCIVKGFGRGKQMGFPTANLQINKEMTIPGPGVYLTKSIIDNKAFWGATSVGSNPTFFQEGTNIETFLLDFSKNIYNKNMKLFFIKKIRDQIYFESIKELIRQISDDVNTIKYLVCKKEKLC